MLNSVLGLATGENKADAILSTVEGPLMAACPASALQLHTDAVLVIDEAAASKLSDRGFINTSKLKTRN